MRKKHALHNEELCQLLLANGKYNDWVVTTAFYSALNFVKHELFPLKFKNKDYVDFDTYYRAEEKYGVDKHTSLHKLITYQLKACNGPYRWLMDACKNSRYNNYQVSPQEAKKASDFLTIIKGHCTKA